MDNASQRWLVAVLAAVFISGIVTMICIYGAGEYGGALFILTPIFIGACPVIIYGKKRSIKYGEACKIGFFALLLYTAGLIVFAIEGLICILMAAPFGILFTWIGSNIAYVIVNKHAKKSVAGLVVLTFSIPLTAFIENHSQPPLQKVVTSMTIDADIQTVWENVVVFPELEKPHEFIFKAGIAYPINATIEGMGVGAMRYCNFTTGSFVEPITVWDEPHLLRFDVIEQSAPMKELSFREVNAPHLHNYFVSKEGQFKLTTLPDGKTLIEGTTWYKHDIKPAFYWKIWSDYIIHKIHERVLRHIKMLSEKSNA